MSSKLTEGEKKEIIVSLKEGLSQNQVARTFRRSPSTINLIARRNNIEPSNIRSQQTERANEARRYSIEGRLDLIEEEFDKIRELLPAVEKASQIRELALATAILIDKYRMEMPEQKGNVPGDDGASAVEKLKIMLHINDADSDDDD